MHCTVISKKFSNGIGACLERRVGSLEAVVFNVSIVVSPLARTLCTLKRARLSRDLKIKKEKRIKIA